MGQWKYRKLEARDVRGTCVRCESYLQKRVASTNKYKPICSSCDKLVNEKRPRWASYPRRPSNYRVYKKDSCENCGFIPEDRCQLDVDHIDGNHYNNNSENLQTLCANCHRLKTKTNKDGMYR